MSFKSVSYQIWKKSEILTYNILTCYYTTAPFRVCTVANYEICDCHSFPCIIKDLSLIYVLCLVKNTIINIFIWKRMKYLNVHWVKQWQINCMDLFIDSSKTGETAKIWATGSRWWLKRQVTPLDQEAMLPIKSLWLAAMWNIRHKYHCDQCSGSQKFVRLQGVV